MFCTTTGGQTFTDTQPIAALPQPKGGVEGSLVQDRTGGALYYSTTTGPGGPVRWAGEEMPINAGARQNLHLFVSHDEASSWQLHTVVDNGLTSYSSLAVLAGGGVAVLWETGYMEGTPKAIVFREIAAATSIDEVAVEVPAGVLKAGPSQEPARIGHGEVPTVRLRNGVSMPLVFTGTWRYNDSVVEAMLREYLSASIGGVGIDTANDYRNQRGVGRAVAAAPNRSAVFLQTKVACCQPGQSPAACASSTAALFQQNLQQLNQPFVDSVMLHFPPLLVGRPPPAGAPAPRCSEEGGAASTCASVRYQWAVLEKQLEQKAARAIGVSNYCESCLGCLANASVFPHFNQVEYCK